MKKKNKSVFKVLDCTLRDGGYYNNWNFSNKIVNEYISSINQSGIDVVEIGFRFLKKIIMEFLQIQRKKLLTI